VIIAWIGALIEMMTKNRKTIISVIIALVIVVIVTTGTVFVLKVINNKTITKNKAVPTLSSANALKLSAVEALKNNDKTKARVLFVDAQKQYNSLNKTKNKNVNQIDVEAQIYLIDHVKSTTSTNNKK
jgi:hypothetical protein